MKMVTGVLCKETSDTDKCQLSVAIGKAIYSKRKSRK